MAGGCRHFVLAAAIVTGCFLIRLAILRRVLLEQFGPGVASRR
jgi:hypothetical protein